MGEKTIFLAWQDKGTSRQWFPVGRLDADVESEKYRFRYICGAKRAEKEAGFPPLVTFPKMNGDYQSPKLFTMFRNRVMWPNRPDFKDYLHSLALAGDSDPIDMLAVSGGYLLTDAYEVFPQLAKQADGGFTCRFFLHGGKHVSPSAQERLDSLAADDELYLALELTRGVLTFWYDACMSNIKLSAEQWGKILDFLLWLRRPVRRSGRGMPAICRGRSVD